MAAGAKPALDPTIASKAETQQVPEAKPTLGQRIMKKLNQIFEHNERLGITRG
jgi:hypothetical protein